MRAVHLAIAMVALLSAPWHTQVSAHEPSPVMHSPRADEWVGRYRREPVENGWHEGRITRAGRGVYRWTNEAGVSWLLEPEPGGETLATGPGNPYGEQGRDTFFSERRGERVVGFWFGDELFVREGVEIRSQRSGGLKGYISSSLADVPAGFGHGVSFYVSVWSLLDQPLAGFQIGLPSTWILPENGDFTEPLCPPGTVARDNWPERGPTWSSVFQTIEGGLGFWVSTRFPSAVPKYRMNGTPNGYNHEISSPGWGFGETAALTREQTGIAQLSNRLLVPPDGLTFRDGTRDGLLGNAWMALPLVPSQEVAGTPTGDQSWTLFLESATFRGPVAFWVPETWTRLSQRYPVIHGRGLDARPGVMGGGAMEVNTVPFFEGLGADGTEYSRIPALRYPVDHEGLTYLMQDVALYSHETLFDAVAAWHSDRSPVSGRFAEAGVHRPALRTRPLSLRQGGDDLPLTGLDDVLETAILDVGEGQAFGLRWKASPHRGRLPEYWKRDGDQLVPVTARDVPDETGLRDQAFARPRSFPSYEPPQPVDDHWTVTDKRLGPFTADLADGSRVTYAWFRFVDQPAVRSTQWTPAARDDLQELVEQIHGSWPIDGRYLPPPSRGRLAELDPAQIVTPPRGFEVGYVPVALSQRLRE